jgi:hypothetical protein
VRGGEERIAGVDRLSFTPSGPDRGAVATKQTPILDVVVNEGEVVEELDGGAKWRGGHRVAASGLAGQHRHRRPDEFAAGDGCAAAGRIDPTEVVANHRRQEGSVFIQSGDGRL